MPTKKPKSRKTATPSERRRAALRTSVQVAVGAADVPTARHLRGWARAATPAGGLVTLRVVGVAEGRRLNAAYRHLDYATNVLSFSYADGEYPGSAGGVHGDIVLCHPVVRREAREQGKSLPAHYAHLVVHGMLHLAGLDHAEPAQAARMEARERRVLAGLGVTDPYETQAAHPRGRSSRAIE
jgi:probable rRNA maturation factor